MNEAVVPNTFDLDAGFLGSYTVVEFEIPITQEELAGLVGASRERVNKAISSFVKLEWIDQNERTYRILKRRELEIRAM